MPNPLKAGPLPRCVVLLNRRLTHTPEPDWDEIQQAAFVRGSADPTEILKATGAYPTYLKRRSARRALVRRSLRALPDL